MQCWLHFVLPVHSFISKNVNGSSNSVIELIIFVYLDQKYITEADFPLQL